jgi:hypothetical protein
MKFKFQNKIAVVLTLVAFQFSFAQKKEDNIGSEVVNVVKPYTPTLSDAFKVQESVVLDDEGNAKKETINYSIFSFPVASTFTPSKGIAEGVDKTKQAHLYDNYATLGFGNYRTLNAELFLNQDLGDNDYVGGMFRHLSSQGGIKGVELDNHFYDTTIDLIYGANTNDMSWNLDLGYQNQVYNWYGLPSGFAKNLSPTDRTLLVSGIDPQHVYNTFSFGGKIDFNEGLLNDANLKLSHFTDSFGSAENRFYAKPSLQFDLMDESINANIILDYVGGTFDKNHTNTNTEPLKYGFTNFGIAPTFVMEEDDWTLDIGAAFFYSLDNQNSSNKFFVYPQVNASYKVVGNLMIFYAGAEGSLKQNSYLDFASENAFLSPTLNIAPTDKQYDLFAGLKGKLINNVSYNVRGSYVNERNKALFTSNDYKNYNENDANENYAFGNSMRVVYDNMRTFSLSGDLKANFADNVTFAVSGTFNSYTNDFQQEAWNLPEVKLNSNIDFNITPKWFAGAAVFYVGERKDIQGNTDIINIVAPSPITLDSYFDVNAHVGYKYNDRLTGFIRANNITNQAYEKWLNYQVQGFQIVAAANYKFDF